MTTGNEGEHFSWGDLIVKSGTAAAILGLIVTSLKTLEKYIPTIIARKMRVDVLAGINELSPVYREMENAIQEDGAERVLMLARKAASLAEENR